MNKFEKWFVKRVIQKEVIQGYEHDKKITNLYGLIYQGCREEFTEDNKPTLDGFLKEQFEKSLRFK